MILHQDLIIEQKTKVRNKEKMNKFIHKYSYNKGQYKLFADLAVNFANMAELFG